MYLVHVPLDKSLTTEYSAFVVSFCCRFEKLPFSPESLLFLTCDRMNTSCPHCVPMCAANPVWHFDLVVILHGAPESSHVSQSPQST